MSVRHSVDAPDPFRTQNLEMLQEMRQLVMHERGIHSAILIDASTEREIIRRDMARLKRIADDGPDRIHLDETGVFTLAHARRHFGSMNGELDIYRILMRSLNAAVIFLHVPPSLSWSRRKSRYEERVFGFPPSEAARVLDIYRRYLEDSYAQLVSVCESLDIPIRQIDASGSIEDTLVSTATVFQELAQERGLMLQSRF